MILSNILTDTPWIFLLNIWWIYFFAAVWRGSLEWRWFVAWSYRRNFRVLKYARNVIFLVKISRLFVNVHSNVCSHASQCVAFVAANCASKSFNSAVRFHVLASLSGAWTCHLTDGTFIGASNSCATLRWIMECFTFSAFLFCRRGMCSSRLIFNFISLETVVSLMSV